MPTTLLILLALAPGASARTVETYDRGNIKFSDEIRAGKHEVKVGIRKPVASDEVETLMHLYMGRACGKEFLYLDMFQRTPETGNIQTADFDFHCTKTPDFFRGDATLQKKALRDWCGDAKAAYLKKLCAKSG